MKRPLRKLARDIFDLAVLIFGLFTYLHRKKKVYIYMCIYIYIYIYIYGQLTYVHTYAYIHAGAVCSLHYGLFSGFSWNFRPLKKMAELLSMNHYVALRTDRWTVHGTVHSVTDCQYCTNSSGCYLRLTIPRLCSRIILNYVHLPQS